MTKSETLSREALIADAMAKGFKVSERKEGGWIVHVPNRKGHPANVQGDFKSKDRAWMIAASLAQEFK